MKTCFVDTIKEHACAREWNFKRATGRRSKKVLLTSTFSHSVSTLRNKFSKDTYNLRVHRIHPSPVAMSSNGLPTTLPPGASETTLSFPNPKNEILVGTFVDAPSPNVVVLCHGYTANKDMCQYGPLAASLAARGYSSFRFDHPCAWRGASERHGPFLMGNHDDEVADIAAAVGFMREQGKNVVCVLGHSKGGTNIIQYAAQIGDVPKIINLSGRFCVLEGVKQRVCGEACIT